MTRTELPSAPWEHWAADLFGPSPSGDYMFVVVDYYSRFFEIEFTKAITSEKIMSILDRVFATDGLSLSLRTDNGTQFVSEQFEEYLRENGIEHRRTTPLWPQANGEVEWQNRSILKLLKLNEETGEGRWTNFWCTVAHCTARLVWALHSFYMDETSALSCPN